MHVCWLARSLARTSEFHWAAVENTHFGNRNKIEREREQKQVRKVCEKLKSTAKNHVCQILTKCALHDSIWCVGLVGGVYHLVFSFWPL